MGQGGYFGGDRRRAPVGGESPLHSLDRALFLPTCFNLGLSGEGVGLGAGAGTPKKKHALPWSVQLGFGPGAQ